MLILSLFLCHRLRLLIDTALLSALSINQSNLVLMFSHLAVGGVYISGTNHTHILAVIDSEIVIGEGEGGGGGGDVEVEIDGELEGPVQVTIRFVCYISCCVASQTI